MVGWGGGKLGLDSFVSCTTLGRARHGFSTPSGFLTKILATCVNCQIVPAYLHFGYNVTTQWPQIKIPVRLFQSISRILGN